MVYQFIFPDVGEGIHEGEIVKWHVKVGDKVKEDQVIAEVETDKAVVEIPSPKTGTIVTLNGKPGDTIKVGSVIAEIDDGSGSAPAKNAKGTSSEAGAPKELPPPKTKAGFGPKSSGKETRAGVLEAVESPEIHKERVESAAAPKEPHETPAPATSHEEKKIVSEEHVAGRVIATPATRKLARELGVDLNTVHPSGAHGRVTVDDVQRAKSGVVSEKKVTDEGREVVTKKSAPLITYEKYGRVLKIPYRSMRKAIGENLSRSWHTAVHVTHHDRVDVTDLVALREKEKKVAANKGFKLTFLAFVIKAVCGTLKSHPYLNSSLDEEHGNIVLKKYYNIGIAVQTDKGLVVPVIRNADKMSILNIAKEIYSLADKARDGQLTPDDMKGGTFTITNVGSIGGEYFTPIINYPECAILGTGTVSDTVIVKDGKAVIRKLMPLSMSFDHRIVDGAKAAEFVNELKTLLSDPDYLMVKVV